MKMLDFKKRVKGFTLTEMVVVIAIITILAAILTPTMTTYFWKSRVRSANASAKMVYSSAQTAVQRYISIDRTANTKSLFSDKTRIVIAYSGETHGFTYSITDGTPASGDVCIQDVVNYVNRMVSDASEHDWSVYIDKYTVKASAFATSAQANSVGYYSTGSITVERIGDMRDSTGGSYGTDYASGFDASLSRQGGKLLILLQSN